MNFKLLAFVPLVLLLTACGKSPEQATAPDQTRTLAVQQSNRTSVMESDKTKLETEKRFLMEQMNKLDVEIAKHDLGINCSSHHTERIIAGEVQENAECSPNDFTEEAKQKVADFTQGSKNDGTTWQPDTFFGPQ